MWLLPDRSSLCDQLKETEIQMHLCFLPITHLIVAAEALVAPAALIDDGRAPPVMRVVLPPYTCQQGRGEDTFPDGLCPDAGLNHPLRCLGF
jgi:hypothetical protein